MAGEMGDSADIMAWMGRYEAVLLSQERIATLRAVTEVCLRPTSIRLMPF